MGRILLLILAILAPWIALLCNDEPEKAILALLLQASLLGWIPASLLAWRSIHAAHPEQQQG